MRLKHLWRMMVKHSFIAAVAMCVGLVGVVSFYQLFVQKPIYVYVTVKVGPGTWWANTARPNAWLIRAIQEAQADPPSSSIAVLDVTYYPYGFFIPTPGQYSGQYEAYVKLKLQVSRLGKSGMYSYNRDTVGVGAPLYIELPRVQFAGTIISLREEKPREAYEDKIITLIKHAPLPWEYETLQIGDTMHNGRRVVLTILDKMQSDDAHIVKMRMRVKKEGTTYLFGEENEIAEGKPLVGAATQNFTFTDYYITKIE